LCVYFTKDCSTPRRALSTMQACKYSAAPDNASLIAPSADRNSHQSLLLRLPAELRNRIWALVLSCDQSLHWRLPGQWHPHLAANSASKIQLNTLRVSRQTYTETASLPFTLNTFVFRDQDEMNALTNRLPVGKITTWYMCRDSDFQHSKFHFDLFSGLETVGVIRFP
jgi:hypothetical protein